MTKRSGRPRRNKRYVARLLYQYADINPKLRAKRRLCEESMILVTATSAQEALRLAKRHARRRRFTIRTTDGGRLAFEFVGVRDLLHLGAECQPNEVWYDIIRLVRPLERRRQILPRETDLNAIRAEQANKRLERPGGHALRQNARRVAAGRSGAKR
jgi:hypothetical protein